MSSSKKITHKGPLLQVIIRVHRLKLATFCILSVMLVFSTQLCDLYSPLLHLSPSLLFSSPPSPFPCANKYTVYTYKVCKGGEGSGVLGLRQIKKPPQSPFTGQIFHMTTFCIAFYESYLSTVYNKQGAGLSRVQCPNL
jgi:hypothetical protein